MLFCFYKSLSIKLEYHTYIKYKGFIQFLYYLILSPNVDSYFHLLNFYNCFFFRIISSSRKHTRKKKKESVVRCIYVIDLIFSSVQRSIAFGLFVALDKKEKKNDKFRHFLLSR